MATADGPEKTTQYLTNEDALRMVGAVYENITHDIIKISVDKAFIYLDAWARKMRHHGDWLGRLSLSCTLTLTLLTAEFKDKFNVTKEYWLLFFSVLTALSLIWLFQVLRNQLFVRVESVNEIIGKFKNLPPPPTKLGFWARVKAYYSRGHYPSSAGQQ
jgi:hypothetical protein